jgi:ACT domain-containing protein
MMELQDCKIVLKLEDKPGELSKVLDIIAKNRGNLFSVSHLREKMKEGAVPVVIKFQANNGDYLKIVSAFQKAELEILEKSIGAVGEGRLSMDFLLIGHVIDTDLRDTIYALCDKDVMIRTLDIGIRSLKDPSSVFVELVATNEKAMEAAMGRLRGVCNKKKLLLIEQIPNST